VALNKWTWEKGVDYWMNKYAKEFPEADIDDARVYFKEGEPWKEFDHVTDSIRHDNRYPDIAAWMDRQLTSESFARFEEEERRYNEQYASRKKTVRDIIIDYQDERDEIERNREMWSADELVEKTKEFQKKKKLLMDSLDFIRELKDEGWSSADVFLADNATEVIIKEVAASMKKPLEDEMSSFRKKTYDYLKRLEKRIDKMGTPSKKEDFEELLAQMKLLLSNIPAGAAAAAEVAPEPSPDKAEALKKARAEFDRGNRPLASRTLLRAGFPAQGIFSLFEDWARTPARPAGGPSFDVDEMRRVLREEVAQVIRQPSVEEYEVEWIQDPKNPDCWDRYTLGKGMKELAAKKISALRNLPLDQVEKMIREGAITNSEVVDIMNSIDPADVKSMLVDAGKVTILRRSSEFENRLMSLPFQWGKGVYFALSSEGRRNSGWASWERLDSLCRVVEENVRTGSWSYQMIREAGIPRSWINSCIREVRRESAGA